MAGEIEERLLRCDKIFIIREKSILRLGHDPFHIVSLYLRYCPMRSTTHLDVSYVVCIRDVTDCV